MQKITNLRACTFNVVLDDECLHVAHELAVCCQSYQCLERLMPGDTDGARLAVWEKAQPGSADALTGCEIPYSAQGCKNQQHVTLLFCRRQGTCEANLSHGTLARFEGCTLAGSTLTPHAEGVRCPQTHVAFFVETLE